MKYRGKRTLDLTLALPALIASAPLQLVTAIAILVTMGRPVLFRQSRPGLRGEPFVLLKFRTMLLEDEASGLVDDAARLTKLGALLRATSLDELPSLINVIRGEMSLVGPRPLLTEYLEEYTDYQRRRHEARPGLTGLAQIGGRNLLDWEDRFRLDVHYIENQSLRTDILILIKTISKVLLRHGVSAPGEATMHRYRRNGQAA